MRDTAKESNMDSGGEVQQPAYGHPTVAVFHVIFKVNTKE